MDLILRGIDDEELVQPFQEQMEEFASRAKHLLDEVTSSMTVQYQHRQPFFLLNNATKSLTECVFTFRNPKMSFWFWSDTWILNWKMQTLFQLQVTCLRLVKSEGLYWEIIIIMIIICRLIWEFLEFRSGPSLVMNSMKPGLIYNRRRRRRKLRCKLVLH